MPIEVHADVRKATRDEFAQLCYDVMACAFEVRKELGRFFDEKIYKRLVAKRFGGVELEVPVVVRFEDFAKPYVLDMLVRGCALFEWKAVDFLAPEHRSQLLHYLLLCDLPNGKLVNIRPEQIQHEFVNTTLRPEDRRRFEVDISGFQPLNDADLSWQQFVTHAIQDWGTGLDVHLYEAASTHVFGGDEAVVQDIDIVVDGTTIGQQKARLTSSNAVLKVTTIHQHEAIFEHHAVQFIQHTTLPAIHWLNITRQCVRFKTMKRQVPK